MPRGWFYDGEMTSPSLARACGQLISVGFDGTEAPDYLLRWIADGEVGSVMLFRPNIAEPAQVAALVGALRRAAPADAPLIVAIDQEGGLVQRLRAPLTEWPDMLSVGAAGDPALTERVGRALGGELAALGIGWDFAPVLDVHTNPDNPVIGNRAFGTTPDAVALHALAFWRGLTRRRPGRIRQAFSRARRHARRFAPDAAGGRARPRAPARGRAGAVRGGGARRHRFDHDRARDLPGARSQLAGDAVAPDPDRDPARRARLHRRDRFR